MTLPRPVPEARRSRRLGLLAGALCLLLPVLGTRAASALEMRIASGDPAFTTVELTGRIERNDAVSVKGFLSRLPDDKPIAVRLSSTGGVIDEAIALGRYLHRAGIPTFVSGPGARCFSACALAFLGGRDRATGAPFRVKSLTARLGLHNFRFASGDRDYTIADMNAAVANTQRQILRIATYISEIGADMELLAMMLETPNASSGTLSNDKALSVGIHLLDEATGQLIDPAPIRRRVSQAD